jgi:deoxycytidylate deaminase
VSESRPIPSASARPLAEGPELIFGLVGATGTDLGVVARSLKQVLATFVYETEVVKVIELLDAFKPWENLPVGPEEDRIETRMNAGDDFRIRLGHGNALARLAVGRIRDLRAQRTGSSQRPEGRRGYILRSLKRVEEVEFLRKVYGPNFFLIGAYSARMDRVASLASAIATSHHSASSEAFRSAAEKLIQRDLEDQTKELGQRVGDTFPLADIFVNSAEAGDLYESLARFARIIFGYPFHTPTRDEYGMFHAQAAAYRSAALSRQVGAAITTQEGSVIAVGTNDVPKAGGGLYWEGDDSDARDHMLRHDSSDVVRRGMLAEVLDRLIGAGWLRDEFGKKSVDQLVNDALRQRVPPILRGTQVMRVVEYGRAVHAEMAAIVDAASRGVAVRSATLYTTTYPCHNCARHIIAAGISRVVYVEPYPKSLTYELHKDAMVNDTSDAGRVAFQAFIGLAPRRYMELFEMVSDRKSSGGDVVEWEKRTALPRNVPADVLYVGRELDDNAKLVDRLRELDIISEEEAKHG